VDSQQSDPFADMKIDVMGAGSFIDMSSSCRTGEILACAFGTSSAFVATGRRKLK